MGSRQLLAVAVVTSLLGLNWSRADEVRYYEQDGVTYCETRRTVQRLIPETRVQQRLETIYREELTTEMRDSLRTYWTPVTESCWEAVWVGRWNPFVTPYIAYRDLPRTYWERRTEVAQVPVTCRRLVPETRTVRTPVATWRTVEQEVITRVPVGGRSTTSSLALTDTSTLSRGEQVGGLCRLDNDPPRYGIGTHWRPSGGTIRR